MPKRALIIVDVLNDFCPPHGALAVKDGDKVVEPLNRVKSEFELVIATRCWHPEVTIHFKKYGGKWPTHSVKNTHGAMFHPGLDVSNVLVVSKGTESDEDGFSGFEGRNLFNNMSLEEILRNNGVEEVYVGGLTTEYCDKATALDACRLGFKTYVFLDACRAVDLNPGDGERAIEEMKLAGAIMTTTEEFIRSQHAGE